MKIRLAKRDDLVELNKLVNSAYRGDSSRQGWTTEADLLDGIRTSESSLEEMISRPNAVILLAEETDLQGCVYLEQQDKTLYLGMLTVKPNVQGKGLGAKLMKASEERAEMLGCNKIRMTVITDRDELIAYYKRKGFEDSGERAPFPNDPKFGIPKKALEFMVMEKAIVLTN
jgi:ribosomal protein S18 acetylase RimI-like enzyme